MAESIGRPPIVDERVLLKLEEAFSMGCTDLEACLLANIGKSTLYKYQDEHPAFTERKEILKETQIMKSRKNITDKITEGDVDTSKWYLERKGKKEFSTKVETDNKNEHIGEINIINYKGASKLKDEQ